MTFRERQRDACMAYTQGRAEGWHLELGADDEYYVAFCQCCKKRTEHDVYTDICVEC
jgi:hypothetical protein